MVLEITVFLMSEVVVDVVECNIKCYRIVWRKDRQRKTAMTSWTNVFSYGTCDINNV